MILHSTSSTTLLQYLGHFTFRPPVPGYRHDAAMFLELRGWADSDNVPAGRASSTGVGSRRASPTSPSGWGSCEPSHPGQEAHRRDGTARSPRGARGRAPRRRRGRAGGRALPAGPHHRRQRSATHRAEPIRGPAHGRVGRRPRRSPHRSRAAPVGAIRHQRLRPRVGRGDGGACPRAGRIPTSSSSTTPPSDDLAALRHQLPTEQVAGMQLTHSGRLLPARARPGPAHRVRAPDPRRSRGCRSGHAHERRRDRRAGGHLRACGRARPGPPGSTSST